MAGKSLVTATDEQKSALKGLACSADRGEADRARAILLTLNGWTSARFAEAYGVRNDTVRLWRCDFARDGSDALKARVAPGPAPLLSQPVADRTNWTLARLADEIAAREGVSISRSHLSRVLREKGGSASSGRDTR